MVQLNKGLKLNQENKKVTGRAAVPPPWDGRREAAARGGWVFGDYLVDAVMLARSITRLLCGGGWWWWAQWWWVVGTRWGVVAIHGDGNGDVAQ